MVTGALPAGYPSEGPYDVILLAGSVEDLPDALFDQLKEGGRLVTIVGIGPVWNGELVSKDRRRDFASGSFQRARAAFARFFHGQVPFNSDLLTAGYSVEFHENSVLPGFDLPADRVLLSRNCRN